MKLDIDLKKFSKDMSNVLNYSSGFFEGIERGKPQLMMHLGRKTKQVLKEYIDAHARSNPALLHHVYEWNMTGSPEARLYDISYTVKGQGISFNSTFRQSSAVKQGSKVPFYSKAEIMEKGVPIRIVPKESTVLTFDDNGQQVFTRKEILVRDPGGPATQGSYEKIFESFFNQYFTQAFLISSGVADRIRDVTIFKAGLNAGKRGGKSVGVATGLKWINSIGAE